MGKLWRQIKIIIIRGRVRIGVEKILIPTENQSSAMEVLLNEPVGTGPGTEETLEIFFRLLFRFKL